MQSEIEAAIQILKSGGVIAIPTETVYGLACDPRSVGAVKKIFAIKGRDDGKALQMIASGMDQVNKIADLNPAEKKIAKKYWPGPLTLLVKLKKDVKLAPQVNPKKIIGIRVTSSQIAQEIVKGFGYPIAATSANRSGSTPAVSGRGVKAAFKNLESSPDYILDIGAIPKNKPTTVASVTEQGKITILRQGGIILDNSQHE